MARLEAELREGNYGVGSLYIQVIKQRVDIGARLASLGSGEEELLRYLVELLRGPGAPPAKGDP